MGARRLFVYGTLRAGQPAHDLLGQSVPSRPLGSPPGGAASVRTTPRFELYDLGDYPALVSPGRTHVVGEVYEVPEGLLEMLDDYEDHPDLYLRTPIELEDGTTAEAYVWNRPGLPPGRRIVSGDWCAM